MAKKTIKVPKVENGVPVGEMEIEVDDNGPSWGPNDKHRLLNHKILRVDGPDKCTGKAMYTQDMRPPGMLFGKFLTSPYAHAKITKLDLGPAQKLKGVKAVLPVVNEGGEVRYEGQPVAAIAAETPEIAEDAANAIAVEYQNLPHVVTYDDAIKPGASQAVPPPPARGGGRQGGGGGRGGRGAQQGSPEEVNAALANCDAVIEAEYRTPILHHCCLETHSITADYKGGDSATVYASTQGTFTIPQDSARELGVQQSKL